jgi:hypothetical protein
MAAFSPKARGKLANIPAAPLYWRASFSCAKETRR